MLAYTYLCHLPLTAPQDMRLRAGRKELEFLWRASRSWGAASDIWTQNYPSGNYGPPVSFNFDYGQLDPPIIVSVRQ